MFFSPFVPSLGRTIGMFLPISPELGVGFSPSRWLSAYQRVINEDGVYALNRLQLMQSARYIFKNEQSFSGIEKMLKVEPYFARAFTDRYGPLKIKLQ